MEIERQLRQLKVSEDYSTLEASFIEFDGLQMNQEEEEGIKKPKEFWGKAHNRPHKDLIDALKKLRKFALEIAEIETDSKTIANWNVFEFTITGDYVLKQSRIEMKLSHLVKRTGKFIGFKIGQVTMYPEKEDNVKYHNADKLTSQVEELIHEVWLYLFHGKADEKGQLSMFSDRVVMRKAS